MAFTKALPFSFVLMIALADCRSCPRNSKYRYTPDKEGGYKDTRGVSDRINKNFSSAEQQQQQQQHSFDKKNSSNGEEFYSDECTYPENYYPQGKREQNNDYPKQEQQQLSFEEKDPAGGEEYSEEETARGKQHAVSDWHRGVDEQRSSLAPDANAYTNRDGYEFQQQQSGGFSNDNVNFDGTQRRPGYDDSSSSPFKRNNNNEQAGQLNDNHNAGNYGYGSAKYFVDYDDPNNGNDYYGGNTFNQQQSDSMNGFASP